MYDNILEITSTLILMPLFPLNIHVITLPYIAIKLSPFLLLLIGWLPARNIYSSGGGAFLWWIYGGSLVLYLIIAFLPANYIFYDFMTGPGLRDHLFSADMSLWARTWAAPFGGRGMDAQLATELMVLRVGDCIPIIYFIIAALFQRSDLKRS